MTGHTNTADLNRSLLGTWRGYQINGHRVAQAHAPEFEFLSDGRLAGSTGCNRFNAEWRLDGDRLTVGPAATTLRLCEPALNEQEAQVLALLNDATGATVAFNGDELQIDTPGSHQFVARRNPDHNLQHTSTTP